VRPHLTTVTRTLHNCDTHISSRLAVPATAGLLLPLVATASAREKLPHSSLAHTNRLRIAIVIATHTGPVE
jgi:hypothetical protein